jgi:hypothetical protein
MSKMINYFLFMVVSLPLGFAQHMERDFYIMKGSQMMIHGEANIHHFSCHLRNAFDSTPFKLRGVLEGKRIYLKVGTINFPVKKLDCGSDGINKDMFDLLKAEQNPEITLDFLDFSAPEWKKKGKTYTSAAHAKISITLAGTTIPYFVHLDLIKVSEDKILLAGQKKLSMTDFKIKPKTYLFGLVKINELIEIDFELILTK